MCFFLFFFEENCVSAMCLLIPEVDIVCGV